MSLILAVILTVAHPSAVRSWPSVLAPTTQTPQPAVVRIIAAERDGMSMGSGALVAVDAHHGLVVTNWHVIRDATGPITVVFPDRTRYGAIVLKVDRDWDLAALAVQRPQAQPIPLATEPPRPGEPLTIAGYGPEGVYLAVAGHCTNYLSPGGNLPAELVEVDVQARKGDSGGPIYNSRGEIAGILFGAGGNFWTGGYTMGSFCGRVRQFLAASYLVFQRLPVKEQGLANVEKVVKRDGENAKMVTAAPVSRSRQSLPQSPDLPTVAAAPAKSPADESALDPRAADSHPERSTRAAGRTADDQHALASQTQAMQTNPVAQVSPPEEKPPTEQPNGIDAIKSVLAVIGIIAIVFHGLRIVSSAVG